MATAIRTTTIGSGSYTEILVPVNCARAQLRIPTDAASAVNIREESGDSTRQDTLQPGESYTVQRDARGFPLFGGSRLVYAIAQSGTVTGVVHCSD